MIRTDNACRPDRLDPASSSTLSGLEIVNGLADGRLPRPPMAETLPFTVLPPSAGRVELRAVPETRFLNPMGIVHGGWAMTMLDSAMGLSALTTLDPGEICPSHETSVKFVRPIFADGRTLHVIGTVISRGRTVITAEGRIEDDGGRLYAKHLELPRCRHRGPSASAATIGGGQAIAAGRGERRHGEPHPLTWAHPPLFRRVCT